MTKAAAMLAGALAGGALLVPHTASAREIVAFTEAPAGTIVVRTAERRLYLGLGNGQALRYRVGVGRAGQQWTGHATIDGKYRRPAWVPPPDIRRAQPNLPAVVASGSPKNPMGVAALTLSGGDYAIHGTNKPGSIGGFVSYGCIRMHNRDVSDLYSRVGIGTPVIVTR